MGHLIDISAKSKMTNIRNDEEILQECERLGEAGVVAALESNDFADNIRPAILWLAQHRLESERLRRNEDREAEHKRHQETMKYTRRTGGVSLIAVVVAFLSLVYQQIDGLEQRKITQKQYNEQQNDAQQQREDAKALLAVQMSVELDKQFDSSDMRKARKRLAFQLLNHKEVSLSGVTDFFDKLAMYKHRNVIDDDLVYQSFSYWILRYWPALKISIESFRNLENDPQYYQDFEELYKDMLADDAKDGLTKISKKEIRRFLEEEASLSQ